jgi:hypothetical protein
MSVLLPGISFLPLAGAVARKSRTLGSPAPRDGHRRTWFEDGLVLAVFSPIDSIMEFAIRHFRTKP